MKWNRGAVAVMVLVAALLLAVLLLQVMTGLITQSQINFQPMVTASPSPGPEAYADGGM